MKLYSWVRRDNVCPIKIILRTHTHTIRLCVSSYRCLFIEVYLYCIRYHSMRICSSEWTVVSIWMGRVTESTHKTHARLTTSPQAVYAPPLIHMRIYISICIYISQEKYFYLDTTRHGSTQKKDDLWSIRLSLAFVSYRVLKIVVYILDTRYIL